MLGSGLVLGNVLPNTDIQYMHVDIYTQQNELGAISAALAIFVNWPRLGLPSSPPPFRIASLSLIQKPSHNDLSVNDKLTAPEVNTLI